MCKLQCTFEHRLASYLVFIIWTVVSISLFVLHYTLPNAVQNIYGIDDKKIASTGTLVFASFFLVLSLILAYGLVKDKIWCITVWLITHVALFVVHAVIFIAAAIMYSIKHNEPKWSAIGRNGTILIFQLIWIGTICVIGKYAIILQRRKKTAKRAPYSAKRSSSCARLFGRSKR